HEGALPVRRAGRAGFALAVLAEVQRRYRNGGVDRRADDVRSAPRALARARLLGSGIALLRGGANGNDLARIGKPIADLLVQHVVRQLIAGDSATVLLQVIRASAYPQILFSRDDD